MEKKINQIGTYLETLEEEGLPPSLASLASASQEESREVLGDDSTPSLPPPPLEGAVLPPAQDQILLDGRGTDAALSGNTMAKKEVAQETTALEPHDAAEDLEK